MKFKKIRTELIIILIFILCFSGNNTHSQTIDYPYDFTFSGNPLVRNHGAADPDVHVWGDTVWMYCSQDHKSFTNDGYAAMDGYHAFSSTDLINDIVTFNLLISFFMFA